MTQKKTKGTPKEGMAIEYSLKICMVLLNEIDVHDQTTAQRVQVSILKIAWYCLK